MSYATAIVASLVDTIIYIHLHSAASMNFKLETLSKELNVNGSSFAKCNHTVWECCFMNYDIGFIMKTSIFFCKKL